MKQNKEINIPTKGMDTDSHPSRMDKESFIHALNTTIEDSSGSFAMLGNEPSNLLCSKFKDGYKVVGFENSLIEGRIYFFLTNPTTGLSEIGYVTNQNDLINLEDTQVSCGCDIQNTLSKPLTDVYSIDNISSLSICSYASLLSEDCTTGFKPCLNFSINHPIKDGNIVIKLEKSGTKIFWTDGYNPQRYIDLSKLDEYKQVGRDLCGVSNITPTCIDCEKLKMQHTYDKACIVAESVVSGGSLEMGIYQGVIAYCDKYGNEISPYFSITNPVSIFDSNLLEFMPSNLAEKTNLGIKFSVNNLDESHNYYKFVVIKNADQTFTESYFVEGIHPITENTIFLYTTSGKLPISAERVVADKPIYKTAGIMTSSNGYLFQADLEQHPVINLQPVVNLMGSFLKWSTVRANEKLYADGANVSKYTGNMRDEVYPYGIQFHTDYGYSTPLFPFIARPPRVSDLKIVSSGVDYNSIKRFSPDCADTERKYYWQFYNTASDGEYCIPEDDGSETELVNYKIKRTCEVVKTLPDGTSTPLDAFYSKSYNLPVDGSFDNIKDFINEDLLRASQIIPEIGLPMYGGYPNNTCVPTIKGITCNNNILLGQSVFVDMVENDKYVLHPKDISQYTHLKESADFQCTDFYTDEYGVPENFEASISVSTAKINKINDDTINESIFRSHFMRLNTDNDKRCSNADIITVDNDSDDFTIAIPNKAYAFQKLSFVSGMPGRKELIEAAWDQIGNQNMDDFSPKAMNIILTLVGFKYTVTTTGSVDDLYTNIETGSSFTLPNEDYYQSSKLSKNARWFKIEKSKNTAKTTVLEFTKAINNNIKDALSTDKYRVSFFKDCESDAYRSSIVNSVDGALFNIPNTDFESDYIYIAIDTMHRLVVSTTAYTGNLNNEYNNVGVAYWSLSIDGCIRVKNRQEEYSSVDVTFDVLTVSKTMDYEMNCKVEIPLLKNCNTVPYKKGEFGYFESTEEYPDNAEMFDSSKLLLDKTTMPESIKDDFEEFFVSSETTDKYVLDKDLTDFRCKKIRHFKFPDSKIIPFMDEFNLVDFSDTMIYPIGVNISNDVIEYFLDQAVVNNLLTKEQRESITKYSIYRGNRYTHKSILGKGLLYDVYKYTETSNNEPAYYSNYPFNDLGDDILNYSNSSRSKFISHPYRGSRNDKFTFHSPDFHFHPSLYSPTEMSFEGYQFGKSFGKFNEVEDHVKWTVLGSKAYSVATSLTVAEIITEKAVIIANASMSAAQGAGIIGKGMAIAAFALVTLATIAKGIIDYGKYRYQWLKMINDLGQPKNFASYYSSVGVYNRFGINTTKDSYIRGLASFKHLKQGNYKISEKSDVGSITKPLTFNNTDRESTFYVSLSSNYPIKYTQEYKSYDNNTIDSGSSSKTIASNEGFNSISTPETSKNIASPYVSMKIYNPSQYGRIESVDWIDTNYCGVLKEQVVENGKIVSKIVDNKCDTIFGGDTFISRFSLKRKFPFFYVNAMNLAPNTAFTYSMYRNVGYPKFFIDAGSDREVNIKKSFFPEIYNDYVVDTPKNNDKFYMSPPSRFYLWYYGIPTFLVESEINLNYRYGGRELREKFYPLVGDYMSWTQENKVPISTDNVYLYNNIYSLRSNAIKLYYYLPQFYNKKFYDDVLNLENVVIYSEQDISEERLDDQWLVYKPNNKYQFSTSNGKLIDLRGIESAQVLGRFENTSVVYNAVDTLRDRVQSLSELEVGNGGIFATRPLEFAKTDLGYAGTQHKAMVSCEGGHFWVDTIRGSVIKLENGAKGLEDITTGKRNWFKEHLPFKIVKYVKNLTHRDLDNNFKGLGISLGWDNRFKRLFLTKLDYVPKSKCIEYIDGEFYINKTVCNGTPQIITCPTGYKYNEVTKLCEKTSTDEQLKNDLNNAVNVEVGDSLPPVIKDDLEKIELTDTKYFTNASFTMAYSLYTKSWISYYSFKPNYYISHNNYFQTGLNYSKRDKEIGLWSHLLTNKSYQVFYGKKYPWTIEIPIENKFYNKSVENISYWLDVRRYHNDYDYAEIQDKGFNKAWIFNNSNNSGLLKLKTAQRNNLYERVTYPKVFGKESEILATINDKKWSFNDFYNRVSIDNSNVPIWNYDINAIDKKINKDTLKFDKKWKNRLRGDWYIVRLSQDEETRLKYVLKWTESTDNVYENY